MNFIDYHISFVSFNLEQSLCFFGGGGEDFHDINIFEVFMLDFFRLTLDLFDYFLIFKFSLNIF